MKKIIAAQILMSVSLYASCAYAACTRSDFTGTWRIYSEMSDSAMRCTLIMPASGSTISTASSCILVGVATRPLRGTLNIGTTCNVSGQVSIGSEVRKIDAWISKGKDSISGMSSKLTPITDGGFFSGVKQ